MAAAVTASRRGRKPKGRRSQISAKVPIEHKLLLEQAAADAGIPLCDYVAVVMAKHHGWEIPTYVEDTNSGHPQLPISA